jgi:phage terminase large subunit-like protein
VPESAVETQVKRGAAEVRSASADPLALLFDPGFTDVLWEYEHSRVDGLLPGELHPKQLEQLRSQARLRALFWGNQTGKTILGAVDVVMLALGRHPWRQFWQPPIVQWASALTWELWENILLPEVLTWIPRERILDAPEPFRHSTKRVIRLRADNGRESRITGKAAEQGPDRYQSARVHQVWLDEEHPESVFDELRPRLIRFGGGTLMTMTPLKGYSWVYSRIYDPWRLGKAAAA